MQALEPSRPSPRVLRQPRSTPPAGGRVLARPRPTSDRFAHGEAAGREKPPARRAEERAAGTATAPRMAGLGFSAQLRFLCGTRPLRTAAVVGQGRGGPRAALLQSERQGVDGAGCPAVVRVSRLQTEHRASPHHCVAGDRPPWPPAKARTECGAGSCGGPARARDGGPAWAGPRRRPVQDSQHRGGRGAGAPASLGGFWGSCRGQDCSAQEDEHEAGAALRADAGRGVLGRVSRLLGWRCVPEVAGAGQHRLGWTDGLNGAGAGAAGKWEAPGGAPVTQGVTAILC